MSAKRAIDIFDRILTSPQSERDAILSAECGDDQLLRAEIESLLESHENASDFLTMPIMDLSSLLHEIAPAESAGQRIGRYELISRIGEGSYGVVWLAVQHEPLQREVALKILKPGLDVASVAARFDAERDALAKLEHPNISRIYDAGIHSSGRPYFVMELVRGEAITDYARSNKLSTNQIARLMIDAAQAVHYAHEKGLIHRDLKPQNLLVTQINGQAVPKVIDFGIAKAVTPQRNAIETLAAFPMGSPAYMSAEQFYAAGEVDARTDVYSLGVILLELLTGRAVRGERNEQSVNAKLSESAVPSTLRHIVLRAIRERPEERYSSAKDLAADLQRFLDGHPVRSGISPVRRLLNTRSYVLATAVLIVGLFLAFFGRFGGSGSQGLIRTPRDLALPERVNVVEEWKLQIAPSNGFTWVDVDSTRRRIYATGQEGGVQELNLDTGQLIGSFTPDDRPIYTGALNRAGNRLAVATSDTDGSNWRIVVFDAQSHATIATLVPRAKVLAMRFVDRAGTRLAASVDCDDAGIDFMDVASSRLVASSHPLMKGLRVNVLEPAGDDRTVLTFDHGVRAVRLDSNTGEVVQSYNDLAGGQLLINVSPANGLVMITGREEQVRTFDLRTGQPLGIYWANQTTSQAGASDDGRTLFSGTEGNTIQAHEASTGRMLWRAKGEIQGPFGIIFLPSESRAVLWNTPGTIRLWKMPESSSRNR